MLITLLAGAFILSIVIIVHEFGHFIVAKKLGIYVKTFSVGFGRKLWKRRVGETLYAVSLLPFGGYVKFAGESEDGKAVKEAPQGRVDDETADSEIDPSRYFIGKNPYVRGAVVFAGPFANYVLAVVVYVGMFAIQGIQTVSNTVIGDIDAGSTADSVGLRIGDRITTVDGEVVSDWDQLVDGLREDREAIHTLGIERDSETLDIDYRMEVEGDGATLGFYYHLSPTVGQVKRDAPAHQAGIRTGDTIVSINDTLIASYYDVERIIHASPDVPLFIGWMRDGIQFTDTITPAPKRVLKEDSRTEFRIVGQIGIGPQYETRRIPIHKAVVMGVESSTHMVVEILSFLKLLFTGKAGLESVGGPILITQMAGDMARWGFNYLLYFLAFFSVNLCIFNLLPILPFDGGHLALFSYEAIFRRRVNRRFRELLGQVGFVLLIILMVFVVLVDVVRCSGSLPSVF